VKKRSKSTKMVHKAVVAAAALRAGKAPLASAPPKAGSARETVTRVVPANRPPMRAT
jgi:uncharacterized membrane protein